jgi:hypothetical protein
MKILPVVSLTTSLWLAVSVSFAQNTNSQFFNNNNASFTDSQSALYNWSMTTANGVSLEPNNVSAGNTRNSGEELPGEEFRGRAFMFVLPTDGGAPGASLLYTTHLVSTTEQQNNPQPDWFRDGSIGLGGRTVEDVQQIRIRALPANDVTGHIGLQLNGGAWVFSTTSYTLSNTAWTLYDFTGLASEQWYSGGFDGTTLDGDLSDNPLVSISGGDLVTGYALYANTAALAGTDARVRLDLMSVTVVPEPATFAALLGLLAIGFAAWRRRR